MRKLLRRTSSVQLTKHKTKRQVRHQRSISDLSMRLRKKEVLKDRGLGDLIRICGAASLYLPTEYAAGTLSVPTCIRATAQYLIQHGKIF